MIARGLLVCCSGGVQDAIPKISSLSYCFPERVETRIFFTENPRGSNKGTLALLAWKAAALPMRLASFLSAVRWRSAQRVALCEINVDTMVSALTPRDISHAEKKHAGSVWLEHETYAWMARQSGALEIAPRPLLSPLYFIWNTHKHLSMSKCFPEIKPADFYSIQKWQYVRMCLMYYIRMYLIVYGMI